MRADCNQRRIRCIAVPTHTYAVRRGPCSEEWRSNETNDRIPRRTSKHNRRKERRLASRKNRTAPVHSLGQHEYGYKKSFDDKRSPIEHTPVIHRYRKKRLQFRMAKAPLRSQQSSRKDRSTAGMAGQPRDPRSHSTLLLPRRIRENRVRFHERSSLCGVLTKLAFRINCEACVTSVAVAKPCRSNHETRIHRFITRACTILRSSKHFGHGKFRFLSE